MQLKPLVQILTKLLDQFGNCTVEYVDDTRTVWPIEEANVKLTETEETVIHLTEDK